jgi:MFS family permease
MVSSFIANRLGRRISLFINLVIYIIGAAFMTGASGSAGEGLVYTGRVLTGWGVGASTMIVPVYVGMYEVGVQFGTMVSEDRSPRGGWRRVVLTEQIGFWIPYGILKTQTGTPQWRIPFAVQLIPSGVSIQHWSTAPLAR